MQRGARSRSWTRRRCISARMKVGFDTRPNARIKDEEVGLFDLGTVQEVTGEEQEVTFRICWCQASIRPCARASEFVADIGKLTIVKAKYAWPACTDDEVTFVGWRVWGTFDDCCCNHNEAGTVGCFSEKTETFARCS